MWTTFKVFIESVTILFPFHVLVFGRQACGFLVPRPGNEPAPPALGSEVLTTGPPGMSLLPFSFLFVFVKNIKRVRQIPDHLKGGLTHSTHCYVKSLFLLFILNTATLSEGQIHIFP